MDIDQSGQPPVNDVPPQQEQPAQQEAPSGVNYMCGDCGKINFLGGRDAVRCTGCGYRILYKLRTKRLIQFEAR